MNIKDFLFYVFIALIGIFAIWSFIIILFTDIPIAEKTMSSSLFMGAITFIGILLNTRHHDDLMEYNNKLFDEKLNSRLLQLNYNDSKQAINKLKRELQMTLFLYNHIRKHVENTNNLNFECLSGRAFLVMQFINFISDLELLDNLPITLRGNFEKKFEDNLSSNPVATDFSKYLEIIKNSPTVDIQNLPFPYYIEYKEVIDKFKNSISKNQNEHMFFLYFESKNISEEDLFNHFEEVFNDLINNTIEDLILRDRDVEIIKKEFKIL